MPPNTSPTPPIVPTPENEPVPTEPTSQPNPVPTDSGQPFHVNSVIGPSQKQSNTKIPLMIGLGILLLGVVGAIVYFAVVAPGMDNAKQNSTEETQLSQQESVSGGTINIATDKPVVTANTVTTKCYTVDLADGMDEAKTRQSSLLGCMVAMSPADMNDMSKYLSYNIMPHTSGESYEQAVERVSTDKNIGAVNLVKTTVSGAEAVVFDTSKGSNAGRQYIVKAPEGKFIYEGSDTRNVTAFFIVGLYSTENKTGAKSVDELVKSFKFAS